MKHETDTDPTTAPAGDAGACAAGADVPTPADAGRGAEASNPREAPLEEVLGSLSPDQKRAIAFFMLGASYVRPELQPILRQAIACARREACSELIADLTGCIILAVLLWGALCVL